MLCGIATSLYYVSLLLHSSQSPNQLTEAKTNYKILTPYGCTAVPMSGGIVLIWDDDYNQGTVYHMSYGRHCEILF